MHPATVHGVGVITKLYFAIFAPFRELLTYLLTYTVCSGRIKLALSLKLMKIEQNLPLKAYGK